MGKAQSKRSVDITTDPKKSGEGDEVAGKVEKIEDIDQKEAGSSTSAAVNGDATSQEKGESSEKKETEESENEKDLTTEKTAEAAAGGATAEGSGDSNAAPNSPESPKEEQKEGAEEISPLADESIKSKSKKDKMKKMWPFRSMSFGKKDKQKPAKSEESTTIPESGTAIAPVTNGEAEKTEESAKKEEGASGDASTVGAAADSTTTTETKTTENGDASVQEQQLNGDKTPSPTEEQPKQNETNESAAAAAATATETTPAATASVSSNNDDTAKENVAEIAATAATTVENVTASVESVAAATPVTNGNAAAEEVAATITSNTEESNNKASIPAVNDVVEKPHQNGTNGDEHHAEAADSVKIPVDAEQIKNKSQIEVNTITADLKLTNLNEVVAAELDQTQSHNITTTTSTPSEISHVDDDNDVVATVQSFDNVPSSNEISKEEEEDQVVASIIAAVSETPKTADTDIINLPSTTTTNIKTTSIDNEVQVPQQQEQLSGEGVSISNVEKPDTEPSLPPPPLPVSQPPSQVSVFAFKDSTETTTTTTVETTTNNETATTTTTTTNDMETTGSTGPANDEDHNELSEVSTSIKEETQNDDKEQSLPEPEPDSITVVHPTTTLLLEDAVNKDEAFEIIDMVPEKDTISTTTTTSELPEEEKLSVRFSTKVTINETIEIDATPVVTITNDEELQKVKSEAEQFVTEVTEKAAEFVMQKQIDAEIKTDEINRADDVIVSVEESVNEETQRLPSTPPPPLETANHDDINDVNDKIEEIMALSENENQKEEKEDHDSNAATFVESKKHDDEEHELEDEKCLAAPVEIPEELSVLKNTQNDEINVDSATTVVGVDSSNDHHSNGCNADDNNTATHHIADDEKVEVPIMMELEFDPPIKGTIEIEAASTAQQSSYGLEDDSSNKDIASAKDLKENVAAEIKTQDLPVTCE